ncbi:Smr/MutS family protein [Flexithrix dorotheae]|uniref:Smr/MutS family protein n=1 Tax=Flexithrix dorotheae TaxID=70993 RepID=UPI0003667C43|nr:Smr/MutS family protein [Flexithrix dorotheae]
MNIGDKVRSIDGIEEGVITAFLPGNNVEVEIEDGFRIPFSRTDLVLVSTQETKVFGDKPAPVMEKRPGMATEIIAEKGLYLAFTHFNDKLLEVNLVNNTDLHIPFIFGEENEGNYTGITAGGLSPKSYKKVNEVNLDKFERWPYFHVQAMFFKKGKFSFKAPLVKKMKFKAATFFKSKKAAPVLNKEAFLFQVDENYKEIVPEELKSSFFNQPSETSEKEKSQARGVVHKEVDLHWEKLGKGKHGIAPENILEVQLEEFEARLDDAIYNGMDEITFIHGVGAGTLRTEIQKRLSKHQHVAYFKDAKKEKFGYGATLVKIK